MRKQGLRLRMLGLPADRPSKRAPPAFRSPEAGPAALSETPPFRGWLPEARTLPDSAPRPEDPASCRPKRQCANLGVSTQTPWDPQAESRGPGGVLRKEPFRAGPGRGRSRTSLKSALERREPRGEARPRGSEGLRASRLAGTGPSRSHSTSSPPAEGRGAARCGRRTRPAPL